MKNRLLLLLTLTAALLLGAGECASAQAQQQQRQPQLPFGDGEQLLYNVSYRAALIPNINIMRVSMRTLEENFGGRPHFHIVGNGRTGGGVKSLFELDDTYHTWLDGRTLLPSRMTSDIRENNYAFRATYNYDWAAMSVSNVRRNRNWSADRYSTIPLADNSGDALSLLYRLRTIDVGALSPGEANVLELVLSEDSKPIIFRYIGRETVKVRKIGTFRALKFTCTMATSDGSTYEEGMTLTVWVSDDRNRIPLLIESPIRVGRVSVTLAEGFRVVHPLTSRVD
ncbi:MAG: DUF3108 domain-containing protein [Alistipes sp.]|jgi:hypothetical protein|nr:DUF3108 domain-containing protein [Alistipes sp.]